MLVGELAQLLSTLHRAVVVHQLADRAGRGETGEPGQVDRGLGVPGTDQHAALAVAQREDVPGLHEVVRLRCRVDQYPDRPGPVRGGDPGADVVPRIDRDRVRRPHPLPVVRRHQRDRQPVQLRTLHRHADHARGVADHERGQLRRRLGRREDQVALVLAVLVVYHDHGPAGTDLVHRVLDRVQSQRHAELTAPASTAGFARCARSTRSQATNPTTQNTPYTMYITALG